MNKSNIAKYVPTQSVTSHTYYWVGLRKSDWVDVEKKGQSRLISTWNWRETEEIGGKCSVMTGSKLQSKQCESEQHFVCVGKCRFS